MCTDSDDEVLTSATLFNGEPRWPLAHFRQNLPPQYLQAERAELACSSSDTEDEFVAGVTLLDDIPQWPVVQSPHHQLPQCMRAAIQLSLTPCSWRMPCFWMILRSPFRSLQGSSKAKAPMLLEFAKMCTNDV